jgi:hypothetical protein
MVVRVSPLSPTASGYADIRAPRYLTKTARILVCFAHGWPRNFTSAMRSSRSVTGGHGRSTTHTHTRARTHEFQVSHSTLPFTLHWFCHTAVQSANENTSYELRFSWQWLWRMSSSEVLHRVALVRTDVSEGRSTSIIRVTRIDELEMALAVTSNQRTLRIDTSVRKSEDESLCLTSESNRQMHHPMNHIHNKEWTIMTWQRSFQQWPHAQRQRRMNPKFSVSLTLHWPSSWQSESVTLQLTISGSVRLGVKP